MLMAGFNTEHFSCLLKQDYYWVFQFLFLIVHILANFASGTGVRLDCDLFVEK